MSADFQTFLDRWQLAGAGERANYGLYLSELCDVLGVPRPQPMQPTSAKNDYTLDRDVIRKHLDGNSTTNFVDLYKRGGKPARVRRGAASHRPVAASGQRNRRQEVRAAHLRDQKRHLHNQTRPRCRKVWHSHSACRARAVSMQHLHLQNGACASHMSGLHVANRTCAVMDRDVHVQSSVCGGKVRVQHLPSRLRCASRSEKPANGG